MHLLRPCVAPVLGVDAVSGEDPPLTPVIEAVVLTAVSIRGAAMFRILHLWTQWHPHETLREKRLL